MNLNQLEKKINSLWEIKELPVDARDAVGEALQALTDGRIRAATRDADGVWHAHQWVKKAVLLHFRLSDMAPMEAGVLHFFDKVDVQGNWPGKGVRVVPPATVRHGAHVEPGVILMPSYVNIGAYVGKGTMIDTWATVGSCAQIGEGCHISGGVGIGGVLEPLQATPVIIEDDCFVGARCEVAEGVIVREGAVLAMGCYVGKSTKLYDATTGTERERGEIPANAVVVPGALPSPDGTHSTYALIIKKYRDAGTDAKTALNEILR